VRSDVVPFLLWRPPLLGSPMTHQSAAKRCSRPRARALLRGQGILGSGSTILTEIDEYRAVVPQAIDLLVMQPSRFRARVTWVELPCVHVFRAWESAARLAFMSMPADRAFIFFPNDRSSLLICDDHSLQNGDIVFCSPAARFHQRATAATRWGPLSAPLDAIHSYAKVLEGSDLAIGASPQVLHLRVAEKRHLFRAHAEASRVAEGYLKSLDHPEVARVLDRELIWALVSCLANGDPITAGLRQREDVTVVMRLHELIQARTLVPLTAEDAIHALGVSRRTLQRSCQNVLGMTAARYLRLRRFRDARRALERAKGTNVDAGDVMKELGFSDVAQFARMYRAAFGEPPLTPVRDWTLPHRRDVGI
jgi:AraC-like DNA-binding protein